MLYTLGTFAGERSGLNRNHTRAAVHQLHVLANRSAAMARGIQHDDGPAVCSVHCEHRALGYDACQSDKQLRDPVFRQLFNFFTTNDAGNPSLSPVISHNSDISVEWYPDRGTSAHLALFHKSIDNWIAYGAARQPVDIVYAAPVAESGPEEAQGTQRVTIRDRDRECPGSRNRRAHVLRQRCQAIWNGFGMEANYTYVDSENPGDRYFDIDGVAHFDAPVQGLSKNNYNAMAMYEKGPISFRLAWSWRSEYLQSTNSNGTNGELRLLCGAGRQRTRRCSKTSHFRCTDDAYGQIDFGTTYRPTEKVSVLARTAAI